ncbi:MAG: hypothetical protein RR365_15480, partial [Bacteroides sp.]
AQELRRAVDTLPDLSDAVEGEYSKEPVIFVTSALEWEERHDIVDERLLEALPGGRTTYRLTPQHFAWLHSRMSNAQAAYSAGRLGDEQWNEMRRRFNRLQERSVSLFGKDTLQQALRTFSPSTYKLPGASAPAKPLPAQHADSSAATPVVERRLPSSCPHTEEELIRKAGEFPNLVVCPVGVPPWWWVAKTKCATNCPGHPDCIRNLYWSEEWLTKIEEKSNEKVR